MCLNTPGPPPSGLIIQKVEGRKTVTMADGRVDEIYSMPISVWEAFIGEKGLWSLVVKKKPSRQSARKGLAASAPAAGE